jgi:integrase
MGPPAKRNGVHVVTKKLADGSLREYHFAYRGGPALRSTPGTSAYDEERRQRQRERDGQSGDRAPIASDEKTLEHIIDGYLSSPEFIKHAGRTKQDYRKILALVTGIEKYRNMPLAFLAEDEGAARREFIHLRNQVATRSLRQADYVWTVLNIVLNWAKVNGDIRLNPCARSGVEKLYDTNRRDKVWTDAQIDAFKAVASPELNLAMALAFWTAQRQGDLLDLTWDAYDGDVIKLTQSKTEVEVSIPVAEPLKTLLDSTPRKNPRILVNQDGVPWSPDGFRVMWGKTCIKAGVANSRHGGVTFHDLRGTAATRMGQARCTTIEIASVTGHGLESQSKRSSLDGYVMRDISLARSAIAKFEAYENAKNQSVNCAQPIDFIEAKKARFTNKIQ